MKKEQLLKMLPKDIVDDILKLDEEDQEEVLLDIIQSLQKGEQIIEVENNESVFTSDGKEPTIIAGGKFKKLSTNAANGGSTFEITGRTHKNEGIPMILPENSIIYSDKLKIGKEFTLLNKEFKGKSFKKASDALSRAEAKIDKLFNQMINDGTSDDVTINSFKIQQAKLALERDRLNSLQEETLEEKRISQEGKDLLKEFQFGGNNESRYRLANIKSNLSNPIQENPIIKGSNITSGESPSKTIISLIQSNSDKNLKPKLHGSIIPYLQEDDVSTAIKDSLKNFINLSEGEFLLEIPKDKIVGFAKQLHVPNDFNKNPKFEIDEITKKELETKLNTREGAMEALYWIFKSKGLDDIQTAAFLTHIDRENNFNSKYFFGEHTDPNSFKKGRGQINNIGIISFNGDRRNELYEFLSNKNKKQYTPSTGIDPTFDNLNYQVDFILNEIKTNDRFKNVKNYFLNNKNNNFNVAVNLLGDEYIAWDAHNKEEPALIKAWDNMNATVANINLLLNRINKTRNFKTIGTPKSEYGSIVYPMKKLNIKQAQFGEYVSDLEETVIYGNGQKRKALEPILPFLTTKTPSLQDYIDNGTISAKRSAVFVPEPDINTDMFINPLKTNEIKEDPKFNFSVTLPKGNEPEDKNRRGTRPDREISTLAKVKRANTLYDSLNAIPDTAYAISRLFEKVNTPARKQLNLTNPYTDYNTRVDTSAQERALDRSAVTMNLSTRAGGVGNSNLIQMITNNNEQRNNILTQAASQSKQLDAAKREGIFQFQNAITQNNMQLDDQWQQKVNMANEVKRQQNHQIIQSVLNAMNRRREARDAYAMSIAEQPYKYDFFGKRHFDKQANEDKLTLFKLFEKYRTSIPTTATTKVEKD